MQTFEPAARLPRNCTVHPFDCLNTRFADFVAVVVSYAILSFYTKGLFINFSGGGRWQTAPRSKEKKGWPPLFLDDKNAWPPPPIRVRKIAYPPFSKHTNIWKVNDPPYMHSLKTGDPPYILPHPSSSEIYEQSLMWLRVDICDFRSFTEGTKKANKYLLPYMQISEWWQISSMCSVLNF